MGIYERRYMQGHITEIKERICAGIIDSGISGAAMQESVFFHHSAQCIVMVFACGPLPPARQSTLTVTLFQSGSSEPVSLSAITSGGTRKRFLRVQEDDDEDVILKKLKTIV